MLQENYWTLCCISVWLGASFTYDWASGWWSLGALRLPQQLKKKKKTNTATLSVCRLLSQEQYRSRREHLQKQDTGQASVQLSSFGRSTSLHSRLTSSIFSLITPMSAEIYSIPFEKNGSLWHCNTKYHHETLERYHWLLRISWTIPNLLPHKLPSYSQTSTVYSHYHFKGYWSLHLLSWKKASIGDHKNLRFWPYCLITIIA